MGDEKGGLPSRQAILDKLSGEAAGSAAGGGSDDAGAAEAGAEAETDLAAGDEDAGEAGAGGGEAAPEAGAAGAEAQSGEGGTKKPDAGGKPAAGAAKLVPLSELQGERKRRQELEAKEKEYQAKLAELDKIKPDYEALREFDRNLGAYLLKNPKEKERLQAGMAGKLEEIGETATDTAAALEAQFKEFGEVDPRLLKVFQTQTKMMQALESRLGTFEKGIIQKETAQRTQAQTQEHVRHFETEIAQITKENPDYANDTDFIDMILDIGAAQNADSLLPIAKAIIDRDKKNKDSAMRALAVKAPKKAGAAVEQGGGASAGPPPEKKPIGSDERLAQIMDRYSQK